MREEGRGNSFLCFKNQPESLNLSRYISQPQFINWSRAHHAYHSIGFLPYFFRKRYNCLSAILYFKNNYSREKARIIMFSNISIIRRSKYITANHDKAMNWTTSRLSDQHIFLQFDKMFLSLDLKNKSIRKRS